MALIEVRNVTGLAGRTTYVVYRLSRMTAWGVKVRSQLARDPTFRSLIPVRVKCSPDDTVGDLKKLIAAQTGTDYRKIQLKKWCVAVRTCPVPSSS